MCWTITLENELVSKGENEQRSPAEGLGKTDEDFNFLNYLLEEGRVGDDRSLHITHAQRLAHKHSNTCQMNDWVQTVVIPVESYYREESGRSSGVD